MQNLPQNKLFLWDDFTPFISKSFQIGDHFFPLFFPKDSESLNILEIQLWKVGAKRGFNGTSKSEHTDKYMDGQTNRLKD